MFNFNYQGLENWIKKKNNIMFNNLAKSDSHLFKYTDFVNLKKKKNKNVLHHTHIMIIRYISESVIDTKFH
jgi:hypothetical protein